MLAEASWGFAMGVSLLAALVTALFVLAVFAVSTVGRLSARDQSRVGDV